MRTDRLRVLVLKVGALKLKGGIGQRRLMSSTTLFRFHWHVSFPSPRFARRVRCGSIRRDLQRWRPWLVDLHLQEIVHKCLHRLARSSSKGFLSNETVATPPLTYHARLVDYPRIQKTWIRCEFVSQSDLSIMRQQFIEVCLVIMASVVK